MKISDRAKRIQPSLARALFNEAKKYDDIIDLTLGDPDLPPPSALYNAAYRAMVDNKIHYSANAGLIEARNAVAKNIKKIWNIECDPQREIAITVGGMEALYLSLLSLVNPGDEVIIFAPYYINYLQMIEMCGGIPVILDVYDSDKGIVIEKEKIYNSITDRTVAIIINSPNNPTGEIISKDGLKIIGDIAVEKDLTIISDEVYRTLIYDNIKHESILGFADLNSRTVLIDSMSKEYSMTGWRVGYVYAPEKLVKNIVKMQENVAACATLSSQYAMIEAYNNSIPNSYIVKTFQQRRDFLFENLSQIKLLKINKSKSTFYMFVDIEKTGMNGIDFAYQLLKKEHIAVVPGEAYGEKYKNYIRIAFTKEIDVLKFAADKIKKFCDKIEEKIIIMFGEIT